MMSYQKFVPLKRSCIWLATYLSLCCLPISIDAVEQQPHLLHVKGSAAVYKAADQLQMQVGVISQGTTALKALEENNRKMSEVIKSLQAVGLSEKEYKTGRFSIRPTYAERPQPMPNNWRPYITGFEVNNTLAIETEQLDKAGELIDQATQAGANSVDNIQFTLKDPQSFKKEAIAQAAQVALEEAQALAAATRVKLNGIYSLSIGEEGPSPRHGVFLAKAMAAPSTPIVSGDIEVSATVSVVFEIE